jgi:hypothetical protein
MLYKRLLKLKEDTQSITDLEVSSFVERYSDTPCIGFATGFCII